MSQSLLHMLRDELPTLKWVFGILVVIIGGYYNLIAEIEEAKKLPKPAVTRTEFDLKDELIRGNIKSNKEKIDKIEEELDRLNDKVYVLKK